MQSPSFQSAMKPAHKRRNYLFLSHHSSGRSSPSVKKNYSEKYLHPLIPETFLRAVKNQVWASKTS